MISPQNVLSWATFFPLLGLGLIVLFAAVRGLAGLSKSALDQASRIIAMVTSGGSLACALLAWHWYDPSVAGYMVSGKDTGVQLVQHFTWIKIFNVEYLMGVDGLSISMVLLTGLISFVATIASMPWWGSAKYTDMAGMTGHTDSHHPKHFSVRMVPGYMAMLLLLQTGMMGTFVSARTCSCSTCSGR